jgi:hypothetical protein
MAKTDKLKQARLLRDAKIEGVSYTAGQVVQFTADQANSLQAEGVADTDPSAVEYALANGATAVIHTLDADNGTQADNAA